MSPFRHLSLPMLMSLIAVIGAQAQEPEPIGSEFQVNAHTTSGQSGADAATDDQGNFVVVWSGAGPGESSGVFGRRFDAAGVPLGIEFVVNSYTTYWQAEAAVAAAADGKFVVVWTSDGQDGDRTGVFAQRFDATGARVGSEFQVNSSTYAYQQSPDVAADRAGNFLVVWWGFGPLTSGINGRLYDASGTPVGGEFVVDLDNFTVPSIPSVGSDPHGTFVVGWQNDNYPPNGNSGRDIYVRRFDATGAALGGEFRVNTSTALGQAYPSVGANADGEFLVAWWSNHLGGSRIFARAFDADGNARGDEFQLGVGRDVMVSPTTTRDFVTVWESSEVVGRVVDAFGRSVGSQFQANTYTTGSQSDPAVAADPEGDFIVTWSGPGPAEPLGVFGQRYEGRLQIIADGTCPGSVGLSVSNAPPGSEVAIVAAAKTGSFIKGGLLCTGTELGVGEPFALPPSFVIVDGEGNGFVDRELPANRCFLQALALADCSVSGVVEVPAVAD